MKKIKLNPEFVMTVQEITDYNNLPDNLPDNKLTLKQIDFVKSLYYKYISKKIDNQAWGQQLYQIELKEKWPSGPRVKEYEAKRFILSHLIEVNTYYKVMDTEQAIKKFYYALSCRPAYCTFLQKVYSSNF
jgi:hypothetical protein